MKHVDLNCDLGEGSVNDAALMPWISSANIACGGHAGDEATMRAAVALALRHGVAVGAHPGLADRTNFGRSEQVVTPGAAAQLVRGQVSTLARVAAAQGARLHHVKLHGALYHQAARDAALAAAVLDALQRMDPVAMIYAPADCVLARLAQQRGGVRLVAEGFADRGYQRDGTLAPRPVPGAVIDDPQRAVEQVLGMVRDGRVIAVDGAEVAVRAETICLHSDGPDPVGLARALSMALQRAGIRVMAPDEKEENA